MQSLKVIAVVLGLFTITACATMSEKMAETMTDGVSATDCFTAGGTIDSSSGASMCMMGEGESKPII